MIYMEDVDSEAHSDRGVLKGDHKPSMKDIGVRASACCRWSGSASSWRSSSSSSASTRCSTTNLIWVLLDSTRARAFLTSTIISAVNVIFTFVAIALIDRLGRKLLLLVGSAGMFVTLAVLAFTFVTAPKRTQQLIDAGTNPNCDLAAELNNPLLSSSGGWIAVISLNAYVAFFAATWGPIVWVLLGEMFPNQFVPLRCQLRHGQLARQLRGLGDVPDPGQYLA